MLKAVKSNVESLSETEKDGERERESWSETENLIQFFHKCLQMLTKKTEETDFERIGEISKESERTGKMNQK